MIAGQGEEDTRGACKVTIRPERVDLEAQGTTGENRVPAMVERVVYVGSILQVIIHLAPGQTIQAWMPERRAATCRRVGRAGDGALPARGAAGAARRRHARSSRPASSTTAEVALTARARPCVREPVDAYSCTKLPTSTVPRCPLREPPVEQVAQRR